MVNKKQLPQLVKTSSNQYKTLSEEEKINTAKQAVSDFLQVMEKLTDEEKKILTKALDDAQNENIEKVKQQIMQL